MASNEVQQLLDLPLATLAALSVGYVSYRIAFTGRDAKHGSVDIVLITFVFGFIAKSVAEAISAHAELAADRQGYAVFAGIVFALLSASVWRKWLSGLTFNRLKAWGISGSDRHTTAWQSMVDRGESPQRLVVRKKDGEQLLTETLFNFNGAPLGPCILGEDGSVGMYVTHRMLAGSDEWEERETFDPAQPDWGYAMTYVPASEIADIRISFHSAETLRAATKWSKRLPRNDAI